MKNAQITRRGNYYTLRKWIIVCIACSFWDDELATQCGGKCNHLCSRAAPKQPQSAHPRTYTMSLYVQLVFFVFLWSLTYYFLLIFGHECLQREKIMFLQFCFFDLWSVYLHSLIMKRCCTFGKHRRSVFPAPPHSSHQVGLSTNYDAHSAWHLLLNLNLFHNRSHDLLFRLCWCSSFINWM